jgi:hypothetical protein
MKLRGPRDGLRLPPGEDASYWIVQRYVCGVTPVSFAARFTVIRVG